MKRLFTMAAVAVIGLLGCSVQRMPLETVYDLSPASFPLKVISVTNWSNGKNLYTFEDQNHNSIAKIYQADPSLRIGTVVNYKEIK